jgi:soluble lytic murein transglycosylase
LTGRAGNRPRLRLALAACAASVLAPAAAHAGPTPIVALRRGYEAFRAGDYPAAAATLAPLVGGELRNQDWILYYLGESEFYAGDYRAAGRHFEQLQKMKGGGRAVAIAPFRAADCLWAAGDYARAGAAYAKLVKRGGGAFDDLALARFRLAELAAARNAAEGQRQFLAVHRDFAAHPLAAEALARAAPPKAAAPLTLSPAERIKRAETLSKDRHWDEALAELASLPADLPPPLAAERDYQIGMTKFHARRDYPGAAELLLKAAPQLTGDRAASAAFHGARALSRVDRDDEAIAGYRQVVATFPRSRYAAEAQYLSGWLDFNRGRFRESLPGLQATLDHFGKSAFADDAAWCLAFAHYLLGETAAARAGFDLYARLPVNDGTADERRARVGYWQARLLEKSGQKDDARAGYLESVRRGPLTFYGLLARARLREMGEKVDPFLPAPTGPAAAPLPAPSAATAAKDPALARADELLDAGMGFEAGADLERNEAAVLHHLGESAGLAALLDRYRRASNYHRAYRLAESHAGGALAVDPAPGSGARVIWEAAYPKAFGALVENYGPPAGNPELFLYAIMRKESGFSPNDVSYADARGLLQMIPPTSAKVAAAADVPFFPDQLYDPETNIRLGAAYIGSLYRKFGRQIPVTAGAFNAGPRAMARWCDQHGHHPMDEFVELIAFAQTREYVKRAVGIYAHYRHLYGPAPYDLPLTVDVKYRADGPDF